MYPCVWHRLPSRFEFKQFLNFFVFVFWTKLCTNKFKLKAQAQSASSRKLKDKRRQARTKPKDKPQPSNDDHG
jgi:hypothetical protein